MTDLQDPFRTGKAYSVGEAAKLARTTPQTVRRWLVGYSAPGHHMEPVFSSRTQSQDTSLQVSFLELVELAVVSRFRQIEKLKLERIRRAHEFAMKRLLVPFPFATLSFSVMGGHLIHEFDVEVPEPHSGLMAFDTEGQWVLPFAVQEEISSLEFGDDDFAVRWFPFGKEAKIVVDPHLAAGRPVVEGTRVPISALKERWTAGDSMDFLAQDYDLEIAVVEEAIRLAAAA